MAYRTPITPAFGLRREIDRLFEDAFGGNDTGRRAFGPSVDVHEDQQALTFEFELPGVSPEQVDVSFENSVLTVRGEKRAAREQKEGARFHHTERSYGSFTRSFQLPSTVDEAGIEASFDHGVLSVRVPKAQRPQPKKIEIRSGSSAGAQQHAVHGAGSNGQGSNGQGSNGQGSNGQGSNAARVESGEAKSKAKATATQGAAESK